MDKIYMNGLSFYGYHGVFPEENKLGQRFKVDLILEMDLQSAGTTDDLEHTVNYGEVYATVKEIVEGEPKKLVETVTESIATTLLSSYPLVQQCTVKVVKPDPPIPGHYDSVAIEITRGRA
ncbi:dihydroneopterin aldolase [Fictibacillus enclensis]|uniref:dihydroneopterin aldolase n=1 Tax=Fictibacillus enclensis TaxID=1017270 RepID=UPI0024C01346|nr:dihydroneopterin aldolase [Fictibacillus enclensis]MDM5196858.1 dihydroneopterin aldolase [Fictibacillus enclensis]MDM5335986.1 dihydroneopterin aldolase [Fictibacillus enclensis]WHY72479.1 dihydroneopterin aldolase [Fictibacillus enclensis]